MTPLLRFCEAAEFLRARKNLGYSVKEIAVITQSKEETVRHWLLIMQKVNWVKPDGTKAKKNVPGNKPILWRWCAED